MVDRTNKVANDGVADDAAIAISKLAGGNDGSASGYFKLGNMMIQWGVSNSFTLTTGADGSATLTFPVAFKAGSIPYVISNPSGYSGAPAFGSGVTSITDTITNSNFIYRSHNYTGGTTGTMYILYHAIGLIA